jgi:hypothetical protein
MHSYGRGLPPFLNTGDQGSKFKEENKDWFGTDDAQTGCDHKGYSETHLFVNDTTKGASIVFWKPDERARFRLLDCQGEAPTNGMSNCDH